MSRPEDDDPARDWDEAADTAVQNADAVPELIPDAVELGLPPPFRPGTTGPVPANSLPGYEVGYRAGAAHAEGEHRRGVLDGRQQVLDALRLAYRSLDIADDLPAQLEAWIRKRLPPA